MLNLEYRAVPSKSRPGMNHTVAIIDWYAPVSCTCEGFKFGIVKANGQPYACTHMKAIWGQRPNQAA